MIYCGDIIGDSSRGDIGLCRENGAKNVAKVAQYSIATNIMFVYEASMLRKIISIMFVFDL